MTGDSEMTVLGLLIVSLLAFFLKGVIGTGTTTIIVSIGSLFIEPKITIVLASFVNIFGGISMVRIDNIRLSNFYWIPIAISMFIGSVFGALLLSIMVSEFFAVLLGAAFFLNALWFIFFKKTELIETDTPSAANYLDLAVGAFAGFCGGFIGINAPPLISHFGKYLSKGFLRKLLVYIFIPAQ